MVFIQHRPLPGDNPLGEHHKGNDGDGRQWEHSQDTEVNGSCGDVDLPQGIPGKDENKGREDQHDAELVLLNEFVHLFVKVINLIHDF